MSRRTPSPEEIVARVRRRESRTARSGLVIVVVIVLVLLLGYAALEAGTRAVDHGPWLIAPDAAWAWFIGLPGSSDELPGVVVAGVILLALGAGLLAAALRPGRRRVRQLPTERVIALADDDVLAQALLRPAQLAAGVGPEQVRVAMDRRGVIVTVRPTSGVPVDPDAVRAAVAEDLPRQGIDAATPVSVTVATSGVVGR